MKRLILIVISILWAFTTNAQRMHFSYDPDFWIYQYNSSSVDSFSHYQLGHRLDYLTGNFGPDSLFLTKSDQFGSTVLRMTGGAYCGTLNWRNKLYLNSFASNPSLNSYHFKLNAFSSTFQLLPDSLKFGPISLDSSDFYTGRLITAGNFLLHATAQFGGNGSPKIVYYNLAASAFKSAFFNQITVDRVIRESRNHIRFPYFTNLNSNKFLLTIDTLRRNIFSENRIVASTLLELDSDLNVTRASVLKYPVADTIRETGLKYVKDIFEVNNDLIVVGNYQRAVFNTPFSDLRTTEIGIMRLDSNSNVVDTIRVGKPSNLSLSTGYINTACWCDGKLFVAATLQTSPEFFIDLDLDDYIYPQGLLIARVDTPFSLAWSKRIFIPGRQFRLYDVHCLNGKMILGGLFSDSTWRTAGGMFSIEVDPDGNYLPLNTSEVSEQVVMNPYPNPFEEQLRLPIMPEPLRSFTLYDLNGKLHRRFEYPETELSIPGLPSGLYLWQAESISGNLWRGKVVRK